MRRRKHLSAARSDDWTIRRRLLPADRCRLQFFGFAIHPEIERLCRFAVPHLDVKGFNDVTAFPLAKSIVRKKTFGCSFS
jgi:hypothetical protein